MRFNISQIMREPSGSTRDYEVDENLNGELAPGQRVHGEVHFLKTDRGIWVSAEMHFEMNMSCSRCLDDSKKMTQIVIEEEFFLEDDLNSYGALDTEGGSSFIDQDYILDLSDTVGQHIILSEPLQFTCDTDCKGMCPQCGTNLNESMCDCNNELMDVQWGRLLKLPQSQDGSDEGEK